MKRMLAFLFLFTTIIVGGCDLSHKHYYNDRGVCSCGDDIAYELVYENEEYVSSSQSVKSNETYYYKFTSHGENGIDFYLESNDVKFDRIEIRADGMLQTVAIRNDDTQKFYSYNTSLANERVYYLKVTYVGEGSLKVFIKNTNS